MDRPSTSKARGVCKYYQTPRGCFAGDKCKFLHGDSTADTKDPSTRLTPYDQAKVCSYFANGFCKHGDKCWFRHIPPPQPDETVFATDPIDESCSICFEKPAVYGLLTGCSHVFCIPCLKEWRDPRAKSEDVVQSGVHKKCPMCRTPSKFITPSSLFYKHDDPRKTQTISAYKDSMARVPCRYFVESKTKSKKLFCPFGKDCFYQHLNDDGTPYTFADGVEASMRVNHFLLFFILKVLIMHIPSALDKTANVALWKRPMICSMTSYSVSTKEASKVLLISLVGSVGSLTSLACRNSRMILRRSFGEGSETRMYLPKIMQPTLMEQPRSVGWWMILLSVIFGSLCTIWYVQICRPYYLRCNDT
ncbi:hypothetical protein C8R42DRAFT_596160 [Lentinula raphanica]|nr:hypothetical protein C8R42DRAFT_596160 [Lentinula raphanica]